MIIPRRRLPHWRPIGKPLFLTWRLYGSLPSHRVFPSGEMTHGQEFVAMDRLLAPARSGPMFLRQPGVAEIVLEEIRLPQYDLHAYVIMPNHVHLLVTPQAEVSGLLKKLKGRSARRANQLMHTTGQPFWQDESYDRWVRNDEEFGRIQRYIECNPLKAGFVAAAEDYAWSSAGARLKSRAD